MVATIPDGASDLSFLPSLIWNYLSYEFEAHSQMSLLEQEARHVQIS